MNTNDLIVNVVLVNTPSEYHLRNAFVSMIIKSSITKE
jgi:hypothetical protein